MKTGTKTPQERLRRFVNSMFASQVEFAKKIGITPMDLQKYLKVGGSVFQSYDKHQKLTELGLNVNWYKTGEGEMLITKIQADPIPGPTTESEYDRLEAIAVKYYGSINNMAVQCGISANVLYMYKNKRNFVLNYMIY